MANKTSGFDRLKPEYKEAWLRLLRSGIYIQGRGMIRNEVDNSYCCLGVLRECIPAHLHADLETRTVDILTRGEAAEAGLDYDVQRLLAEMNDSKKSSLDFLQIANWIEQNL